MWLLEYLLPTLPAGRRLDSLTLAVRQDDQAVDNAQMCNRLRLVRWDEFTSNGSRFRDMCPIEGLHIQVERPLTWDDELRALLGGLCSTLRLNLQTVDHVDVSAHESGW